MALRRGVPNKVMARYTVMAPIHVIAVRRGAGYPGFIVMNTAHEASSAISVPSKRSFLFCSRIPFFLFGAINRIGHNYIGP